MILVSQKIMYIIQKMDTKFNYDLKYKYENCINDMYLHENVDTYIHKSLKNYLNSVKDKKNIISRIIRWIYKYHVNVYLLNLIIDRVIYDIDGNETLKFLFVYVSEELCEFDSDSSCDDD